MIAKSSILLLCNILVAFSTLPANAQSNYSCQWHRGTQKLGADILDKAYGVGIDSRGNSYVVDSRNNRIQKFDSDGKLLLQFGTKGNGHGEFLDPLGLAIDSDDNVYVADYNNNRIQKIYF